MRSTPIRLESFGDDGAASVRRLEGSLAVQLRREYSPSRTLKERRYEEERVAEQQVSFSSDRRENQGARRLPGQDAQPAPYLGQGSRSRCRRGVEVERGAGLVARRLDLHRRDLQERREDDLRQRGRSEGSFGPLQLQS